MFVGVTNCETRGQLVFTIIFLHVECKQCQNFKYRPPLITYTVQVNKMSPYSDSNYLSFTVSIVTTVSLLWCSIDKYTNYCQNYCLSYCSVEMKLLSNYCTV